MKQSEPQFCKRIWLAGRSWALPFIYFSGLVGDQRWHLLVCSGSLAEGAWSTTLEAPACFAVKNSSTPVMLTVVRVGVTKWHERILVLCEISQQWSTSLLEYTWLPLVARLTARQTNRMLDKFLRFFFITDLCNRSCNCQNNATQRCWMQERICTKYPWSCYNRTLCRCAFIQWGKPV